MGGADFGGQARWHNAFREWAEAELGDSRQVYARRADAAEDAPLVFMPDGEAHRFREAAKSGALICPVPGCPSKKLTTCAYREKRDHFRHMQKPDKKKYSWHDPSYVRLATESLLRHWMAGQDQVVEVRAATIKYKDGKEPISFILVAGLSDGSKVALCYVDKRLGADAWEELDDVLRSKGLVGAWIFAPTETYFALPKPADSNAEEGKNLILDKPIYRRMRRRGSWPLLLNLDKEEWGNVVVPGRRRAAALGFSLPDLDHVAHLALSQLAKSRLCSYGIATPAITEGVLRKSSGD